jgi:hypothetical protein
LRPARDRNPFFILDPRELRALDSDGFRFGFVRKIPYRDAARRARGKLLAGKFGGRS